MGQTRKRVGKDGKPRYTAYYDDIRGQRRSAGTFASKKEADKAWQRAEVKVSEGGTGEPARGRQRFRDYIENTWLPNHEMEASTREGYTYAIYKHLMPEFGGMRMVDILPEHVRAWIAKLKNQGMKSVTIQCNKIILSAIFTTALDDQVTYLHPCRGVKTPPIARKPLQIVTPEQFDDVYTALPEGTFRLLAETEIESGLRWGELSELRPKDLNLKTRILTVSRTVVELNPKFHPEGGHFLVKDYPKDKEYRRFKLSAQMTEKLEDHIRAARLTRDDLFFHMPPQDKPRARITEIPDPEALGRTEPNEKGRHLQPRHPQRLHRRPLPLRLLPRRLLPLPSRPPRQRQGQPAPSPHAHDGRPHPQRLVPPQHLEPSHRRSWPRLQADHARPTPRPRLLAPQRRRRPTDSQRTPRPRLHRHNRALPTHPPRRRRNSPRGPRQNPEQVKSSIRWQLHATGTRAFQSRGHPQEK